MKNRTLIIAAADHAQLEAVIELARRRSSAPEHDLAALENELRRASIVSDEKVPPNVVRMNSAVRVRDLDWDETETYTLVYPHEADITRYRISILAPSRRSAVGLSRRRPHRMAGARWRQTASRPGDSFQGGRCRFIVGQRVTDGSKTERRLNGR